MFFITRGLHINFVINVSNVIMDFRLENCLYAIKGDYPRKVFWFIYPTTSTY